MTKPKILVLILTAVLALSSSILAGPPKDAKAEAAAQMSEEFNTEETIALLQIEYSLWLDAVLSGDKSEAEYLEKNLLGRINLDIMVSQESVRSMAREVALTPGDQVAQESDANDSDEFKQAIRHLNAKEAIFRSAVKTEAFSNKYRLLGDYIDLLRRELKMPRLKLVSNQASSNNNGSQPDAAPGSSE